MKIPRILFLMPLSIILLIQLSGCANKEVPSLRTVRLNEVVRSVFYAPMYVAINNGYFEEEGLKIDLSTGNGADKTMQNVLSKSADIGFCGPEQVIYINNQDKEDYPILFAQLTQKDGSFLVGRTQENTFKWESLKGKTVLGGRPAGVPEMVLEYVLKSHGLEPGKDVNVITNLAFTAVPGAFKAGSGDYAALFEPSGSVLEADKSGFIVSSIGKEAGPIPYTAFFATKSYIASNPEVIQSFTNAIYKSQLWVAKNSDFDVAKTIMPFFPGTDIQILEKVVKNYREINAFAADPLIHQEDLTRLENIIQDYDAKLLPSIPDFNKIVDPRFSEKAITEYNLAQ